jgi:glycosyltransferase involved in cell wall biosynthesis
MGMGGTQRATKFVKYLPKFDWQPFVVTVKDVYYYAHDNSLLNEIKSIPIYRTESLDPLRILARFKKSKKRSAEKPATNKAKTIFNKINEIICGWLLIPDSKILWLPFAILTTFRLIRRKKIKIVFTTSPPQSAHLAGLILKLITSVKWVADFRDDWTGGESQACPTFLHYIINRFLEKLVLKKADVIIGMCNHLTGVLQKKSGTNKRKFKTVMNGYDRDDFIGALNTPVNKKFTISHCGSISKVSNPEPFIAALKLLLNEFQELKEQIRIQFIGIDIYGQLRQLVKKYQLTEYISPIQYLPHHEALKKVMTSHLLLITIIKKTEEEIITGKIFEYLGSGKPILLVSTKGYVANAVQSLQRGIVVNNQDVNGIKNAILYYYNQFRKGCLSVHDPLSVPEFDRENLTRELASIFNMLLKGGFVEN